MKVTFSPGQYVSRLNPDIEAIIQQMAAEHLHLAPGHRVEDLEESLSRGLFHPVAYH